MSILDIFNNPTGTDSKSAIKSDRLIRFPQGEKPAAGASYVPYEVNDQASLTNSALHNEYSTLGTPNVNLANSKYNAGQKIPSQNLDMSPNVINDGKSGFVHEYKPSNQYRDKFTTLPQ
jgi:hypothetical protein